MAGSPPMAEDEMQSLYQWIDEIPLSRPKRNIGRDFSDGVLAAELVAHFFPKLVELHNYSAANGVSQKMYNWGTLNQKVFKKMGFQVTKPDVDGVCNSTAGVVERVLRNLQLKIDEIRETGSLPKPKAKQRTPPAVKSAGVPPGRPAEGGMRQEGGRRGVRAPEAKVPATSDPYAEPRQGKPRRGEREAHAEPARPSRHDPAPAYYEPPAPQYLPPQPAYHVQKDVDTEILVEKEQTIQELRETVDILETKIRKLEQLVKLKDTKITSLQGKLNAVQGH